MSLYGVLAQVLLGKLTLLGATLMSKAGVHRKVVSERLGHASVGIRWLRALISYPHPVQPVKGIFLFA